MKEISKEEASGTSEIVDLIPTKCLNCGNKEGIFQRFFLLNMPVENENIHRQVKKELKEKYGLSYYGYSEKNKAVITAAKCPQCDNEKMNWDY